MRLAHKRKVQSKLQKRVKALVAAVNQPAEQPIKAIVAASVESVATTVVSSSISLTAKQQQVLDIVAQQGDGMNSKSIGMAAGQEEAKAASWATGALKKLVESDLVEKIQLDGNKVIYQIK